MPTPIKRTSSLISYSKEHHFGLLLVWKIRQGIKREIITERIANYILYFFEADLKYHFKDEERYLFTLLPTNNNLRQIAEQEHSKIFNLITSIHLDKTNETLILEFAEILENHIHFEERVLFNELQLIISKKEIIEIEGRIARNSQAIDTNWEDMFWE
ncbi:MAG: hemerythrin domain-containing protein [Chitinophagia bacterium]|jgi:hypothetical protein|nr:hemerythrin domain-containing protein [Chitinophagia bacterium]